MAERRLECPGCHTSLLVPTELASRKIRCAFCRTLFDINKPRRVVIEEDIIATWLKGRSPDDEDSDHVPFDPSEQTYIAPAADEPHGKPRGSNAAAAHPPHGEHELHRQRHEPAVATAHREIRVVRLLPRAVEFEFPAERLMDAEFRSAIPRRCMRCNSRMQLGCFLVMFAPQILKDIDLAREHQAGHISLTSQELGELRGDKLLQRLPAAPGVPHPGNLPFPYFVCQHCNSVGLVAGQIQVNSETHKGTCRLMLANVAVAAEFFAAVGDTRTDDYQRLMEAVGKLQTDPWNALPVNVRHRVEQWFRRFSGEAFLAFVPDADFGGSEVGMAGMLISTRRVVYHRPPRHRETTVDDHFVIHAFADGDKQQVRLESSRLSTVTMATDHAGIKTLREGLHLAGVPVKWN